MEEVNDTSRSPDLAPETTGATNDIPLVAACREQGCGTVCGRGPCPSAGSCEGRVRPTVERARLEQTWPGASIYRPTEEK